MNPVSCICPYLGSTKSVNHGIRTGLFFLSEAVFYQDMGWVHVLLPQITRTLTSNPNFLKTALRAS